MHCRAVDISRVTLIGASSADEMSTSKLRFEEDVVAPMLVHQRRARLARLAHVVDGGKLFEIERHRRRDVFGFGARRRDAHRDEFADLAHLAGGEHRLLGDLEARQRRHGADRLDADQIGCGEDAGAIALRHLYAADPRMRQRTAHERDVLQSGEPDVGDELPAATHQAIVFLARQPRADALSGAAQRRKIALIAHSMAFSSIELTLPRLRRNGLRQNWRDSRRIACRRADRTRAAADVRR